MSTQQIIRAWRDEEFRDSLNAEQLETLPESPIGAIDLSEGELMEAQGGTDPSAIASLVSGLIISWAVSHFAHC